MTQLERMASICYHLKYVMVAGASGQGDNEGEDDRRGIDAKYHLLRAKELLDNLIEKWDD